MMDVEIVNELRKHREALTQAVNERDLNAYMSSLHPSFEAENLDGQTRSYDDTVRFALFVLPDPNFRERVEPEKIQVDGGAATLCVTHNESNKWFLLKLHVWLRRAETWRRIDGQGLRVRKEPEREKSVISLQPVRIHLTIPCGQALFLFYSRRIGDSGRATLKESFDYLEKSRVD